MRTAFQEFVEPHLNPEMVAIWTQFEDGERKGEQKGRRVNFRRLLTQRFLHPFSKGSGSIE